MRKIGLWILFGVIAFGLLGGGVLCYALELPQTVPVMKKLYKLLDQQEQVLAIHLDMDNISLDAKAFWTNATGERYFGLNSGEIILYYQDEVVYLDNGRGFELSDLLSEAPEEAHLVWLLLLSDFHQEEQNGAITYSFTVGDRLLQATELLTPKYRMFAKKWAGLTVSLTERDSQILKIRISDQSGFHLSAEVLDEKPDPIPTELMMIMKAEAAIESEQIMPLIKSCMELADVQAIGANAHVNLECGPLPVSINAQFFCTDGAIWFVRGEHALRLTEHGAVGTIPVFFGFAFEILRNGEWELFDDRSGNYTLTIPPEYVHSLFDQLLPEAAGMALDFNDAVCMILVQENRIKHIELSCSGEMPFLITRIPIAFSVNLEMMEGPVTLPAEITGS